MKSLLITFFLLLALSCYAKKPEKSGIPKQQITSVTNDFRKNDGFNVIRVGSLGTSIFKSFMKVSLKADDDFDEDSEMILNLIDGIKRVDIVEYDDCSNDVKDRFNKRLEAILKGSNVLLQAIDGDDEVNIYGLPSEGDDSVNDLIIHVPGDHALICLYGKVSMNAVMELAASR